MLYEERYASPFRDGHVKVQHRRAPNFLERVGGSLAGSVLGLVLVIAASILLFWNEGRSVYTYDVIREAETRCVAIGNSDFAADHLVNELVYLTGPLATQKTLTDPVYGVSVWSARLRRRVDMYQWVQETRTEEHKNQDGTVTTVTHYSYTQEWRDHVVNSASFDDIRYENPRNMAVPSTELTADPVSLGAYTLGKEAVELISNWQRVELTSHSEHPLYNNMLYHGDPHHPRTGDLRVYFEWAGSTEAGHQDKVSVVALLTPGRVLMPCPSQAHHGYTVLYLHMGTLTIQEVFSSQHSSNTALTWGLRLLGLVLLCVAFNLVTRIIVTLFDWLPLVRELLAISAFLLSCVLALSVTLTVVAVAWIRYRPLYGLALLAGALLPFLITKLLPDKKQREQ